jgi:hypothetical protein
MPKRLTVIDNKPHRSFKEPPAGIENVGRKKKFDISPKE